MIIIRSNNSRAEPVGHICSICIHHFASATCCVLISWVLWQPSTIIIIIDIMVIIIITIIIIIIIIIIDY